MSYDNPRINLNMSMLDVISSLTDGNAGAIKVCTEVLAKAKTIDPDRVLGTLGVFFSFDNMDCYGPRIWMLYKDVCKENLNHMMGLLRCVNMGLLRESVLQAAIDGNAKLPIDDLMHDLKIKLPGFVTQS